VRRARTETWEPVPSAFGYAENSRGLGLAEMAGAIRAGRPHRASGELAFHVLDVMETCYESSREGRHIEVSSRCERPEPMKEGLPFGEL
jgi:predicted dehydrogenase